MCVAGCSTTKATPNSLDPASPQSRSLETLWWVLLAMASVVFIVVMTLILVGAMKKSRGHNPGTWSDNRFIVVGGIVLPTIVLFAVGVLTITHIPDVRADPTSGALKVEVVGHDWWWEVRYPDQHIVSANEIRMPVGRDVDVTLRSDDVIHSLWIPQLGGKTDLIPGQTNHMVLHADRTGTFTAECAEFCGLQHTKMLLFAVVSNHDDFEAWVDGHGTAGATSAATSPTPQERRGAEVFIAQACGACHSVAGTRATGTRGPDLTDFGSRQSVGAGILPNTSDAVGEWITAQPAGQGGQPHARFQPLRRGPGRPRRLSPQPEVGAPSWRSTRNRSAGSAGSWRRRRRITRSSRSGRTGRASPASSPPWITSAWGCATSTPRSCSSSWPGSRP